MRTTNQSNRRNKPCIFIRKRYSIEVHGNVDFDSVPNKPLKDQPSKRDLFLFKRKNVEVAEYVTAKSVANFDENSEEDSKE